jgi:TPR repeat protein/membrane protease YdiL (CAAX protease family)
MNLKFGAALIGLVALGLGAAVFAELPAPAPDAIAWEVTSADKNGRTGCHLQRAKNSTSFTVIYVAEMSPAARAGLKIGDTVTSIDDIPCGALDGNDARHFLTGNVGGILTLKVHRDGEPERSVNLTYEPYLNVYQSGLQAGDAEAEFAVGYFFAAYCSSPNHWTVAAQWLRKAADQGNARAETDLGYQYVYGYGVPQDFKAGASWYLKAAQQDDDVAEQRLAELYSWGDGVPKSDADAFKWNLRAAQKGNAKAECAVGYAYQTGDPVSRDDHVAYTWYCRSAKQGNPYGAWCLSYMYEAGRGVPRDLAAAYRWIRVAHAALPNNQEITQSTVILSLKSFVETRDSSSVDLPLVLSAFHREISIAFAVLLFVYLAIGISLLAYGLARSNYPPPLLQIFGWATFLIESQFVAVCAVFLYGRILSADLLLVAIVVLGAVPLVISSIGKTRRLIWRPPSVNWRHVLRFSAGAYGAFIMVMAVFHYLYDYAAGGSLPAQPTLALIGKTKDASAWVAYTTIALVFPVAEEILFRGYFFDALRRRFSGLFTVVATAFCFSICHMQGFYIFPLFCFGLMLGWVKTKTDSLFPCVAIHALNNAILLTFGV